MNDATYIAVSIFQSGAVHYYHTVAELEKYLEVETYQPRDAYTTINGKQFRVTWWHGKLNFQPTSGFRDLLDLGNGLFVAIENANSEPKPGRPLTSEESERHAQNQPWRFREIERHNMKISTQAQHTDGPWVVFPAPGLDIGSTSWGFVASCTLRPSPEEMKANAALIAAAPELLESLKEALEVMGTWDDAEPGWATIARAAIAKAGGAK